MGVRAGVRQGESQAVRCERVADAVEQGDEPGVAEVVDDDPDGAGPGAGEDRGGTVGAVAEFGGRCEHGRAACVGDPGVVAEHHRDE